MSTPLSKCCGAPVRVSGGEDEPDRGGTRFYVCKFCGKPTDAIEPAKVGGERDEHCHAALDGECAWSGCPQTRDGEPEKSGRHCPLDHREPTDADMTIDEAIAVLNSLDDCHWWREDNDVEIGALPIANSYNVWLPHAAAIAAAKAIKGKDGLR